MRVFDAGGRPLDLGAKLGEGGEGAVYEVVGHPEVVAKLYSSPLDSLKATKLVAMSEAVRDDLLRVAAWPIGVVCRGARGSISGLLMPKVTNHREAHNLYSPKQRRLEFPNADWHFLVWAACNAAAAVQTVHEAGHVIGDINQKNFLVAPDATVKLIDCDSFQVTARQQVFPCLVGVPEFTPPELHGQPFDRVQRTPNHDAFGLAVLIFHFLFMGRHPFAGRYGGVGDMPPDRAIREMRFAYSQTAASRQMSPPPHSLSLSATSFAVASLFERAFGVQGVHGRRPSAAEWLDALNQLKREIAVCRHDASHKYHRSLQQCPWCVIERSGGPQFFITVIPVSANGSTRGFEFATVVSAIRRVPTPPPAPRAAPAIPEPSVTAVASIPPTLAALRWGGRACFLVAGMLLILVLGGVLPPILLWLVLLLGGGGLSFYGHPKITADRELRRSALRAAEEQQRRLVESWLREAGRAVDAFSTKKAQLEQLAREYQELPNRQQQEVLALERNKERLQRQEFLERHPLVHADIPGIGEGLKITLIANSIETAADIDQSVLEVSGIGPARYATLLAWRQSIEARFRFDAGRAVPAAALATIRHRFLTRKAEIEGLLQKGQRELEELSRRAIRLATPPIQQLKAAAYQVAQARANTRV
jgi:DNA-binding helix-hairpin-helix protein with protein kinase domain